MSQRYPGVALVTGAASGIGRCTASAFAQDGCSKIALLDQNVSGLEETKRLVEEILKSSSTGTGTATPDILVIQVDVTSAESVTAAFTKVKAHFNRVDYGVQCAGIGSPGVDSVSCSIEIFDRQTAVNYRGLRLCARELIKIMRDQTLDSEVYPEARIPPLRAQRGSIVNIASTLAVSGLPLTAPYSGSKGGVLAVTRSDAMDCIGLRIRVNAVLPGLIDTPMTSSTPEERTYLEENVLPRIPIRRLGQPEEIADICVFLSGNRASYVTGQAVGVDGGVLGGAC